MKRACFMWLAVSVLVSAQDWSLERLFSRPYVWGTPPSNPVWSKHGHTLVFLWNSEGNRFKDLYAYDPDQQQRVRLTNLESQKDDLLLTGEEKDQRQKQYLLPLTGIGSFTLSQDGSQVAFVFKGDIYLVKTDGRGTPFRLTRTKPAESQPQFSPDGKKLAYIRAGQLHTQDLTNGQLWQVTDIEQSAGELSGYRWSFDGKSFVYGVNKPPARTQIVTNYSGKLAATRPFSRSIAGDDPEEGAYFVIPSEGGKPVPVEAGSMGKSYIELPDWSPDSKHLLITSVNAAMKKMQILTADATTGKSTVLFEGTDPRWVENDFASWSPDSRFVYFLNDQDGYSHLYTVSIDGGKPAQVTHGNWEIHDEPFSRPPQWIGDHLYYSSTEPGPDQRYWYRIRPDGSGKELLSGERGLNIGVLSEDGEHKAVLRANLNHPMELYVDGKQITSSPTAEFARYHWPETRFYTFKSKDGATVNAKMLLPPNYNPEAKSRRRWPAVFFVHGSGYATSVLQQWGSYVDIRYAYNCYLANKGYVVFDIDYRGSSGYGRDWRTDVYLHLGGPDLDDILGGVEYARKLGNIDMNRLGMWGISYGGFMTDMALFQAPGVFKAGAAWAAVNDWENYNAPYTRQRLNTPQSDPEAYRRSSPIWFSGQLKDHLLIVHGMVDDNVLFQDAVQLTEKLIQEHKPFEHIFYPEETHGFVRDDTWIDAFRRTTEWFDRYLMQ